MGSNFIHLIRTGSNVFFLKKSKMTNKDLLKEKKKSLSEAAMLAVLRREEQEEAL